VYADYDVTTAMSMSLMSGTSRNILTVQVEPASFSPGIPQGRSLDITVGGTVKPANGSWEVLWQGALVASSGLANGWSVEADHTSLYGKDDTHGYIVTAPATARAASNYILHVGGAGGTGSFDVLAAGSRATAPVLQPLSLASSVLTGSGTTTGTVTLDAPAPPGPVGNRSPRR
jgi:hypothetical protein